MSQGKKVEWSERDYKQFEALCGIQCTRDEICGVMDNISPHTLYKIVAAHYTDENGKPLSFAQIYKKYASSGKASLRRSQFRLAEKSATMAIFLGKQYLGQHDCMADDESAKTEKVVPIIDDI